MRFCHFMMECMRTKYSLSACVLLSTGCLWPWWENARLLSASECIQLEGCVILWSPLEVYRRESSVLEQVQVQSELQSKWGWCYPSKWYTWWMEKAPQCGCVSTILLKWPPKGRWNLFGGYLATKAFININFMPNSLVCSLIVNRLVISKMSFSPLRKVRSFRKYFIWEATVRFLL